MFLQFSPFCSIKSLMRCLHLSYWKKWAANWTTPSWKRPQSMNKKTRNNPSNLRSSAFLVIWIGNSRKWRSEFWICTMHRPMSQMSSKSFSKRYRCSDWIASNWPRQGNVRLFSLRRAFRIICKKHGMEISPWRTISWPRLKWDIFQQNNYFNKFLNDNNFFLKMFISFISLGFLAPFLAFDDRYAKRVKT